MKSPDPAGMFSITRHPNFQFRDLPDCRPANASTEREPPIFRRSYRAAGTRSLYVMSLAFIRATVAALHSVLPAGVGKPSAVSLAASTRDDGELVGSIRAKMGASDDA